MAWVSTGFGAILAVIATVTVSVMFGFPLWLSLLLYPVLAICFTAIVFTGVLLRSFKNAPQEAAVTVAQPDNPDRVFTSPL